MAQWHAVFFLALTIDFQGGFLSLRTQDLKVSGGTRSCTDIKGECFAVFCSRRRIRQSGGFSLTTALESVRSVAAFGALLVSIQIFILAGRGNNAGKSIVRSSLASRKTFHALRSVWIRRAVSCL